MKRTIIKFTALVFMLMSLGSCFFDEESPVGFEPAAYLENKSEHGIVVCWNYCFSYYIPDLIARTDTLLPAQYYSSSFEEELDSAAYYNPLLFIVEPGSKSCVECIKYDPLDRLFEDLPHDTLSVFILHADTVCKYSWDEIRNNYNIIVRYDLSKDDVKSFGGYTIPFPPTEAMRDMKMWPPYEEVRRRYEK